MFKIITIPRKPERMEFFDEEGTPFYLTAERSKVDLKIISDLYESILSPSHLDIIWMASGDDDFREPLEKAKKRGIKINVASWPENLSSKLRTLTGKYCYNISSLFDSSFMR